MVRTMARRGEFLLFLARGAGRTGSERRVPQEGSGGRGVLTVDTGGTVAFGAGAKPGRGSALCGARAGVHSGDGSNFVSLVACDRPVCRVGTCVF